MVRQGILKGVYSPKTRQALARIPERYRLDGLAVSCWRGGREDQPPGGGPG